jgi:hypothetical protein
MEYTTYNRRYLENVVKNESLLDGRMYKAFHKFGPAIIEYGGLILGFSKFPLLPQLPQKNDACFKSGQKQLKINDLGLLV